MRYCEENNVTIPLKLIYNLVISYENNKTFDKCKDLLIKISNKTPNSVFWLHLAICYINLNDLDAAEEALCEANTISIIIIFIIDNENGNIWGYLALLSLLRDPPKFTEADQSLEHV